MVNSCDESEAALEPFERPVWLKFGDYTRGRTRFQARFSLECRLAKLFAHTVVKTARIRVLAVFRFVAFERAGVDG